MGGGLFEGAVSEALEEEEGWLREVPCCLGSFLVGEARTDCDLVLYRAFSVLLRAVCFSFLLLFFFFSFVFFFFFLFLKTRTEVAASLPFPPL